MIDNRGDFSCRFCGRLYQDGGENCDIHDCHGFNPESYMPTATGIYLDRFAERNELRRGMIRETWREWFRGLAWGNLIDSLFFFPIPGWRLETDAELRQRMIDKIREEARIAEQTYRALVGGRI